MIINYVYYLILFVITCIKGEQVLECWSLRDCAISEFRCPGFSRKTIEKLPDEPYRIKCNKIECDMGGETFEPGDLFRMGNFEYLCFVNTANNTYGVKVTTCFLDDEAIPANGFSTNHDGPYFTCTSHEDSKRFELTRVSREDWLLGHGVDITHHDPDHEDDQWLSSVKVCGSRLICYGDGVDCSTDHATCVCPQNHTTQFMGLQSNGKLIMACKEMSCQVDSDHHYHVGTQFKYHQFQYDCSADISTDTYKLKATGCFTPIESKHMDVGDRHQEQYNGMIYSYECIDRGSKLELTEHSRPAEIPRLDPNLFLPEEDEIPPVYLAFELEDTEWNPDLANPSSNLYLIFSAKIVQALNEYLVEVLGPNAEKIAMDLFKRSADGSRVDVHVVVNARPADESQQEVDFDPVLSLDRAVNTIQQALQSRRIGQFTVDPITVRQGIDTFGLDTVRRSDDMQQVKLVARGRAAHGESVNKLLSGSESFDLGDVISSGKCDNCVRYRLSRPPDDL